jgi:hypothetical protein
MKTEMLTQKEPSSTKYMQTLSVKLKELEEAGFKVQFKATDKGLLSLSTQCLYQPNEVKVVHFYRFEGETNPSDNAIVYAIETNTGEKGTLVNGYGVDTDPLVANFIVRVEAIKK